MGGQRSSLVRGPMQADLNQARRAGGRAAKPRCSISEVLPFDRLPVWLGKPPSSFAPGVDIRRGHPFCCAAYRKAIELAPDWCDPYLNLGAMLCENNRCEEALDVYRQGLEYCSIEPKFDTTSAVNSARRNSMLIASCAGCDAHWRLA